MDENPTPNLMTINDLSNDPEFTRLFTSHAIRHQIRAAYPRPSASGISIPGNGLLEVGAIIRLGRKLYIDKQLYRSWVLSHREGGAHG